MKIDERKWWRSGTAVVVWIALGTVVVHLAMGWRYGFDRDELMALDDARNLAWGYVQYPPMTAFFGWVALKLFGTSLGGFRLFASLAQAGALVLTGLMAKEIWGEERDVISNQLSVISERRNSKIKNRNSEKEARLDDRREIPRAEDSARNDGFFVAGEARHENSCRNDGRWEGGKWAMVVATLAGVPFCLGAGALMQYISFDYLCWVWVAYCVVRVVSGESQWRVASGEWREKEVISDQRPEIRKRDEGFAEVARLEVGSKPAPSAESAKSAAPGSRYGDCADMGRSMQRPYEDWRGEEKWWVGVGVGMGLGLLAKYTMGFWAVGVVVGVLATGARKYLRSVWLWAGVVLAWAIFLPNLVWEWKRNFVSLDFLRFLHTRDMATGVTDWFLLGQLELTMLMAPLALAGLVFCFGWGRENSGGWLVASGERRSKKYKSSKMEGEEIHDGETVIAEGESWQSGGSPKTQVRKADLGHPVRETRWRILGWMYVVPLVLLLVMRGRDYYLAPAYPMLYAAGAVWVGKKWLVAGGEWREEKEVISDQLPGISEQRSETGDRGPGGRGVGKFEARRGDRRGIHREMRDGKPLPRSEDSARDDSVSSKWKYDGIWRKVIWVALVMDIVAAGAMALPIAPIGSRWWKLAAEVDLVFPDEIGWVEFVEGVAKVRDGLPAEDRARVGILAGNYGEVGALNLYGEKYGLPQAMSGVNSSWERGYGDPPEVLIVVGYPRELLEQEFASVVVGGRTRNSYGVANEETVEVPEIFVCRGMKGSWEEFWGKVRKFA